MISLSGKQGLFAICLIFFNSVLFADVTVAVFEGAKPVVFTDQNGRATGFYPELLRHIFEEAGEEVSFVTGLGFKEAYEKVLDGEIDIMPALILTPERQELFDFNKEVFMVSWSQLFIRPDDRVENVLELSNQKIALMEGGQNGKNFINFMASFDIPFEAVYFTSFPEMVEAVLREEVKGMISFGSFARTETRLEGSGILFAPTQAFLGIRKGGDPRILKTVDEALHQMKRMENSVYQQEMDKWLLVGKTVEIIPRWVYGTLIAIAFIAVSVVLFIVLLGLRVRQIRARLEESETGYQRVFHAATDLISVVDFSADNMGVIIDVNESFCQRTGFSRDELVGIDLLDFYPDEMKAKVKADMDLIKNEGFMFSEVHLMKKSGGMLITEASSKTFESDGKLWLMTVYRDMSYKKEFDSAISAIQQKYTTIADYNYDWEFWLGDDRKFVYISPSCKRISGYNVSDFQNDPGLMSEIVYKDDRSRWAAHFCSGTESPDDSQDLEIRIRAKDGGIRWLHHQCRKIYGKDGESLGIRGTFRDITERKSIEDQLNRKKRLESLGVLAGGVAHDFNNILAIIKGFSDLGMRSKNGDEETKSLFETINTASLRGEDLTSQILDFSRSRTTDTKPVQISAMVREILKLLRVSFPDNIRIEDDLKTNSFAMADEGQVHRVIMNIAKNARLAMPEGGVLSIDLRELYPAEVQTLVPGFSAKRCMELRFADTGVGMDEEVADRIFDPFFTTRETGEGTGMGLSVVHGIISGWNGRINVDSAPGKGTALKIYLPILDYDIIVENDKESVHPNEKAAGIFIVDDEKPLLKLYEAYLKSSGLKSTGFSVCSEAIDAFSGDSEAYAMAILDMSMPQMKGDELAQELKKIKPDLMILLCTGYSDSIDPASLPDYVDGLLNKPFTEKSLLNAVQQMLDKTSG